MTKASLRAYDWRMTETSNKEDNPQLPVNIKTRGPVLPHGLTNKEDQFAILVANGASLSDAYRRIYRPNNNVKPTTIWQHAHYIYTKPNVQARVKAILDAKELDARHDPRRVKSFIENLMIEFASDSQVQVTNRIKAAELLAKIAGVTTDKADITITSKDEAQALRQELEAKLQTLLQVPDKSE